MSSLIIPFNHKPYNTSMVTSLTGAYTIPSGYYAVVTPQSADIQVNSAYIGSRRFMSGSGTTLFNVGASLCTYRISATLTGSQGVTFSVPVNGIYVTEYSAAGALGSVDLYSTIKTDSLQIVSTAPSASGTVHFLHNPVPFWVKSGDIIEGISFMVTLYQDIT